MRRITISQLTGAQVAVLGVPWDRSSSFLRGAALAPSHVRDAYACPSSNLSLEDGRDLAGEPRLADVGDVVFDSELRSSGVEHGTGPRVEGASGVGHGTGPRVEGASRAGAGFSRPFEAIRTAARDVLARGASFVALGGDHSITYPLLRAVADRHGPVTLLQIDAHPDLYEEFEGDRFSHACPMARIMEDGLATRLVQVGIRTMVPVQQRQAERFGVDVVDMRALVAGVRPAFDGPLYVTLDLDALDPAFAPGVSHHQPGGLSTRDVLTLLQSIDAPVVSADIVELNPTRDVNGVTAMVAAKFLKELVGKLLR